MKIGRREFIKLSGLATLSVLFGCKKNDFHTLQKSHVGKTIPVEPDFSVHEEPELTVSVTDVPLTPTPEVPEQISEQTREVHAFTEAQEKKYQEIEAIYASIGMNFYWSRERLLELAKKESNSFVPNQYLIVDKSIPQDQVDLTLKMWGAVFPSERLLGLIDKLVFWHDGYAGYSARQVFLNLYSVGDFGYDRLAIWHEITHAISSHQDHSGHFTLEELLELELLQAKIVTSSDKDILAVYNESYHNTSDGIQNNPLYRMGIELYSFQFDENNDIEKQLITKRNEFSSDTFSDHDNIKLAQVLVTVLKQNNYPTIRPELKSIYSKYMQEVLTEVIAQWVGYNVRNSGNYSDYPVNRDLVARYLTVAAGIPGQVNLDNLDQDFRYNIAALPILIPYTTQ